MFGRKFCKIMCFLCLTIASLPVQAMFSSRPPKVKAPKARPVTKAPTVPKMPTMPKAPTVSAPEMTRPEMFEPSVSTFSTREEISPFTEVPTISTTPTISTETIARTPRAPRSTSATKASPSLWDRFKMYWTQKRAYHTTVPTYQTKKSPGSSAGFKFNFTFSKLFKFQNPFSFKTWSTGGTKYSSRSSRMSPEEIDKWFNDYIERKNLSRGMYRERVDVMKHILGNAKNDSEAADYLYNALKYVFANLDEEDKKDPKVISDMNQLALVALSMKLDRFINFFKLNGFPTTSSYYEQKYGSGGSSEKTGSGKQEGAGTGSTGRQYSRSYQRERSDRARARAESVQWFRKYMGIPEGQGIIILDAATRVFDNDVNNEEALYYLYPMVEDWLWTHRIFEADPATTKGMNTIYKIALKHKHLADYVKLFEDNGFGDQSKKQGQEKAKEQSYRKKEGGYRQSSGQYQRKSEERSYNRSYSEGAARISDYDILGVKQGASPEEIHKKYLELVKKYHPDLFMNKPEEKRKKAEQKLKKINAAYDRIGRK